MRTMCAGALALALLAAAPAQAPEPLNYDQSVQCYAFMITVNDIQSIGDDTPPPMLRHYAGLALSRARSLAAAAGRSPEQLQADMDAAEQWVFSGLYHGRFDGKTPGDPPLSAYLDVCSAALDLDAKER